MTEQEHHSNRMLHALNEAHRLGRITRADYRARRRDLLASLGESNSVTARNAIVPNREPAPGRVDRTRMTRTVALDEASTLFPERRATLRVLWLTVGGMVLVSLLLACLMLRSSVP